MEALRPRSKNFAGQAVIGTVLVFFVGLIGRLVYINAHDGSRLMARAERQQRSEIPIPARRGLILDCRGRIIAGTTLRQSVFVDPVVLPDVKVAADKLSSILGVDPGEVVPDLLAAGEKRFFVIKRGVTKEQANQVSRSGVYGLGVFSEPYRTYPMNEVAAALVGFVSPDGKGISGLEYQCDKWLSGQNGVKTIVRDARRKAFWLADGGYRPAQDGFYVVLTIDAEIQANAERELEEVVSRFKAESAVAIVMHPQTGAILAMANAPGFDPNNYRNYGTALYRNKAITDPYEPGSTFKPFIASGALAEKVVRLGEVFNCEHGAWQDGPRLLRDHHPYDYLTFEEVLIKSSNIGMGKIGKRLGNESLYRYAKLFGFGDKTGVELTGEDSGTVRPLSRWNSFSTTSIPMGQEITVTPLQLARGYCAIANGGKVVTPYLLRAVMDASGNVISDFTPPLPEEPVISPDIIATMKDKILVEVVRQAASQSAKLPNYTVFGKTGTAQIAKRGGGGYQANAYVSSFVGGAPAKNPELVVFVAVRKPQKSIGYYGAIVAAPTAARIMAHGLAYLGVPPEPPEEVNPSVANQKASIPGPVGFDSNLQLGVAFDGSSVED